MPRKNKRVVYAIVDETYGDEATYGDKAKSTWLKVGTAFVNRDGSLTVLLDALPINGKLNIRDAEEEEEAEEVDEEGEIG